MKSRPAAALLLCAASLVASPAAASVAGSWRVSGAVSDRPFTLDCHFEPHGAGFGGICMEVAGGDSHVQAGKSHTVNNGAIAGSKVSWGYPIAVMMMKLDIAFTGSLEGDRMSGAVTASGRKGSFTAARK